MSLDAEAYNSLDRNRLRKVSRLIHIRPLQHRHVIRQQLQRDGEDDGRDAIVGGRDGEHGYALALDHAGMFIGEDDQLIT